VNRIFLVCHGATDAVKQARFPADEPLSRPLPALAGPSRPDGLGRGPELRCAQTAEALGWDAVVDDALADLDHGSWRGRSPAEVDQHELMAWMTDPEAAPHGGEPVSAVLERVAAWLDRQADVGRLGVVTSPAVARAAILAALGAPASAFWRVDIAPLTVTQLTGGPGRWTVRETGRPLD
jgi:broad specificity phosphatase PhoE